MKLVLSSIIKRNTALSLSLSLKVHEIMVADLLLGFIMKTTSALSLSVDGNGVVLLGRGRELE